LQIQLYRVGLPGASCRHSVADVSTGNRLVVENNRGLGGSPNVGTMIGKFKIGKGVSVADVYEPYPIARRVLSVAAGVFLIYNFVSWIGSTTSHPLYARWLDISEPFTDAVAAIFPGINSSTAYLESRHFSYMIPAVRNLLSINFALLLLLPSCFAVAACIDLFKDPEQVLRSIDAISKRVPMSIREVGVRAAMFLFFFFPPLYFGLASDPYVTGFTPTIAYYVVAFGVIGIALNIAISCVISLVAVKRRRHAELAH